MNEELITREGYEQLKADIEHIENVERIEVAQHENEKTYLSGGFACQF